MKHVKWCIPTRAVFQKIYFSKLKNGDSPSLHLCVFFFSLSISAVRNPKSSNLIC